MPFHFQCLDLQSSLFFRRWRFPVDVTVVVVVVVVVVAVVGVVFVVGNVTVVADAVVCRR